MGRIPPQLAASALVLGALGAACGGGRAVDFVGDPDAPCTLSSGGSAAPGPVTIAGSGLSESAARRLDGGDDHAVSGRIAPTLVEVDCRGRVRPGLAASWESLDGGRQWLFRLRDDARFRDGRPVTVEDVVAAWRRGAPRADGAAGWIRTAPAPDRIATRGPRSLRVVLPHAVPSPSIFAHPDFGVAPDGARAAGPTAREGSGAPGAELRRVGSPGADDRDLLEGGVDLLLTREAEAVAYASGLPDYSVHPLPPDRTYVLLIPPGGPEIAALPPAGDERDAARRSLADDAVPGGARAAEGPHWWDAERRPAAASGAACGPADPVLERRAGSPRRSEGAADRPGRIVHPAGDRVAGAVASRLVALSTATPPPRTGGLAPDAFRRALRRGAHAAYVLPLPRRVLDRCSAIAGLREAAPWLVAGPGLRAPAVVALVDTRAWLLAKRGLGRLRLDWDGLPRPVERER